MWNDTPESRALVTEVSKEIVSEIAPEELEMADELLDDYYADPEVHEGKDDSLEFGSEFLAASTPVVAMALHALFGFIVSEVWASAQKEGATMIAQKMKVLLNPAKEQPEPALGLTQEQLEKAKKLIKKEAQRGGMNPKKAEDLALKIVARIALKP